MQVMYLGRAPRTKETLPDFLKWCRVTRHPLVFRGLTGSQRTPGLGHHKGGDMGDSRLRCKMKVLDNYLQANYRVHFSKTLGFFNPQRNNCIPSSHLSRK